MPGQLHFFSLGFLILDLHLHQAAKNLWYDATAGIGACWMLWGRTSMDSHPYLEMLGDVTSIAALFLGCLRGPAVNRICSTRVLSTIGGMCYTIYLFHGPMLMLFLNRGTARLAFGQSYLMNLAIQATLVTGMIILASSLLFVLLERPFMEKGWHVRVIEWLRHTTIPPKPVPPP